MLPTFPATKVRCALVCADMRVGGTRRVWIPARGGVPGTSPALSAAPQPLPTPAAHTRCPHPLPRKAPAVGGTLKPHTITR